MVAHCATLSNEVYPSDILSSSGSLLLLLFSLFLSVSIFLLSSTKSSSSTTWRRCDAINPVTVHEQFGPWLFCAININRENGERCCGLVDDLQLVVFFMPLVFQETDNWHVTGMEVLGNTAILCPGLVCQVRRSWDRHERCTAVLIASMVILPVDMPHGGYDELNSIVELEVVKIIIEEGKRMGQGFRHRRGLQLRAQSWWW